MGSETVNWDEDFIKALREGTLVLFVGAGVSRDAGYPDGECLARMVTSRCEVITALKHPLQDHYQDLRDLGHPVHEYVKNIVLDCDVCIRPKQANSAVLLDLFRDKTSVKIVTTNYDPLIETLAEHRGWKGKLNIRTPIDPGQGERVSGIVHLHGWVHGEDPLEMIVTRGDFRKAYYDDNQWAQTFLRRLFKYNSVAFVGYSGDHPIEYLLESFIWDSDHIHYVFLPEHQRAKEMLPVGTNQAAITSPQDALLRGTQTVMHKLVDQCKRKLLPLWYEECEDEPKHRNLWEKIKQLVRAGKEGMPI